MNERVSVVWFKRDLRWSDHRPMAEAIWAGFPLLPVYIWEPSLENDVHTSERHLQFIFSSLEEMNFYSPKNELKIIIFRAEALAFFEYLIVNRLLGGVYSHEETGIRLTYDRDLSVQRLLKNNNVVWKEFPSGGVVRKLQNRDGWSQNWWKVMEAPTAEPEYERCILPDSQFINNLKKTFPEPVPLDYQRYPSEFQPAGRRYALRYLNDFLNSRIERYQKDISYPQASRRSCSRLSAYLAWGNLSVREVVQAVGQSGPDYQHIKTAFTDRVRWRCHFMQKFETEDRIEFEPFNPAYSKIRTEPNPVFFRAWQEGRTGFPLADAVMRCLYATGYINMRMRAMLVSFLTHHLWLDWREGAHHLARLFLDFEPGIHYPQFHMQGCTTGIHTVRVYNPTLQARKLDPQAEFIKKWVPELAKLPAYAAHDPSVLTHMEQTFYNFKPGKDYPLPIVNLQITQKRAQEVLNYLQDRDPDVIAYAQKILLKHTVPGRIV